MQGRGFTVKRLWYILDPLSRRLLRRIGGGTETPLWVRRLKLSAETTEKEVLSFTRKL